MGYSNAIAKAVSVATLGLFATVMLVMALAPKPVPVRRLKIFATSGNQQARRRVMCSRRLEKSLPTEPSQEPAV